jgi:hypothetical protein
MKLLKKQDARLRILPANAPSLASEQALLNERNDIAKEVHPSEILPNEAAQYQSLSSFNPHQPSTPPGRHRQRRLSRQDTRQEIPNVRKVLAFAILAIGVWALLPLLSMIDTSSIGLMAGTAQQAALNPAIAVINYLAKLMVS